VSRNPVHTSIGGRRLQGALHQAESLCQARGVRLTLHRRQVLEILCRSPRPMGAYDILDELLQQIPGARPTTVYRALAFLQQQGLIHRIESLNAFLGCLHPEHPHAGQFLICRRCGLVQDLENEEVEHCLERAAEASGFELDSRVVEVIGCCASCTGKGR